MSVLEEPDDQGNDLLVGVLQDVVAGIGQMMGARLGPALPPHTIIAGWRVSWSRVCATPDSVVQVGCHGDMGMSRTKALMATREVQSR
jgi:hypothetical protein